MMDILTVDLECFYDNDYTLSKMTTEAYLRDPRMEDILWSIKVNDTPAFWVRPDRAIHFFQNEVDWPNTAVLCHHAHFDVARLTWGYGVRPGFILDTLSMARVVDGPRAGNSLEDLVVRHGVGTKGNYVTFAKGKHLADFTPAELREYGQYGCNDSDTTYLLAQKLMPHLPWNELRLIDLTVRMFTEPVFEGNVPLLLAAVQSERTRKIELLRRVGVLCKLCGGEGCTKCDGTGVDKKPVGSNEQFANLLRAFDVEPETKTSPTTGKQIYAFARTDSAMQSLLEDADEEVRFLAEARIAVKSNIIETRAQKYASCAQRGLIPMYLKHAGAHTLRPSGSDGMNCLNLSNQNTNRPEMAVIKQSICAPKGYKIVRADSSQGEARLLAWQANQSDLVEAFRQGRDIYSEFATDVYGRTVDRKRNPDDYIPGQVGKISILSFGFGSGWYTAALGFLKGVLGAPPIQFTPQHIAAMNIDGSRFLNSPKKLQQVNDMPSRLNLNDRLVHCIVSDALVSRYRARYSKIAFGTKQEEGYWTTMEHVITAMIEGREMTFGAHGIMRTGKDCIYTPTGLKLNYRGIQRDENGNASYFDGRVRKNIYGSLLAENCLAGDSLILTPYGCKPIIELTVHDQVWDGHSWVTHCGVVHKGDQPVISFGGVALTPDHPVLVDDQWVHANETSYEEATSSFGRYYRPPVRVVGRAGLRWKRWQKVLLALQMRMRAWMRAYSVSGYEGWNEVLRLCNAPVHSRVAHNPRYDAAPGVLGMEVHAGPLPPPNTPGVQKLWRAGHNGLQTLAGQLRGFLGRYGRQLPTRFDSRPARQQPRLLQVQLPVGHLSGAGPELPQTVLRRHPNGADAGMGSHRKIRAESDDAAVSAWCRLANGAIVRPAEPIETTVPVFDIKNAGPRNRFAVVGADGRMFLAHNCTQHLHRLIVGDQMLDLADAGVFGKLWPYDEIVAVVPEDAAELALQYMLQVLSTPPAWAVGLPLAAEGGIGDTYAEAK